MLRSVCNTNWAQYVWTRAPTMKLCHGMFKHRCPCYPDRLIGWFELLTTIAHDQSHLRKETDTKSVKEP